MTENKAATFESSLERLEAIVQQLESDTVTLDDSIKLFREGRELARRCETLLKSAQTQIDEAVAGSAQPAQSTERKSNGTPSVLPLLDGESDDEIPF